MILIFHTLNIFFFHIFKAAKSGMKTKLVMNKPTLLLENLNATKTIKTTSGHTLQIADVFSSAKITQHNISTAPSKSPNPIIDPLQQKKIDAIVDAMVKDSGVDESGLFICGMANCNALLKGSINFFQHQETHKANVFSCYHCKKMLSTEVDITNHYNDEHLLKR